MKYWRWYEIAKFVVGIVVYGLVLLLMGRGYYLFAVAIGIPPGSSESGFLSAALTAITGFIIGAYTVQKLEL